MSKGIYRSVDVERVSVSVFVAALTAATVIVGIDIAKLDLFAAFAVETGSIVQIVRFRQTTQMEFFLRLIEAIVMAGKRVEVVLEATGTYGDAVREQLASRGAVIYMMAAKHVRDAKELFDGVPSKHDAKDATVLARLRGQGLGKPWTALDPLRRDLRALIEMRNVHHDPLMQGYSRLEALLARHWPELTSVVDLYNTKSVWALLCEMPSPGLIAAAPEAARALLLQRSARALKDEAITKILVSAKGTIGVVPTEMEREQLRRVVAEMLRHRVEVRAIDRELREKMAAVPEFAQLSEWLSPATAAVLVACVGDPRTFHCAAAYEKACGLNLKEHSSGNPKHRGLHITQRGSSRARQYLYLFAMRWLQRDPAARAWAQHRQCWSRPGGKIGALVALMRKAARAVWHLSRGESYQASKLFDLRRLGLDASAGSQQEPVTERDDDDVTPGARADEASPSSRTESAPTCDTPSRRTATASASRDDTQTPHTASSTASRVHAASPMRAAAPTSSTPSSDDTMSTSLDDTAAQRTASPTTPQLRDAASTRAAIHASTDTATAQVETPTRDRRGRFQSRASTLASRDSSATTATPAATPPRSDEHTTRQPIAEAPALSPRTHGTSAPQKSRLTETMERVGRLMARGQ